MERIEFGEVFDLKPTKARLAGVAQVSNLLCRRLPVGHAQTRLIAGGLEIRDTADWKSALQVAAYRTQNSAQWSKILPVRNG
jgi:hypothetical protein